MAPVLTFLGEGTNNSGTTTDSASITITTGRPVVVCFASALTSTNCSSMQLDPAGTPQAFTRLSRGVSTGNNCEGEFWYLDSPSTVTAVVRATHGSTASRRVIQVFEVTGHDTSTSTAWRDTASLVENSTQVTTHEVVVTSASGDLPVAMCALQNSSSSPTLTLNGSSTLVDAILGGTSLRDYVVNGTGAASVTLGGTTGSAVGSVLIGMNINVAAAASSIAAISSGYHQRGIR